MGAEAYGFVAFFALIQSWFQLLDLGLSPTLARETARYAGGATDAMSLRSLLRVMELIFSGAAILGGASIMLASRFIAYHWLKIEHLQVNEVRNAIFLIAAVVSLRLVSGLYRGSITGFERMVWLGGFNSAVATARFLLIFLVFKLIGTSLLIFFEYQLLIAVIEILVLARKSYSLMPDMEIDVPKKLLGFSALRSRLTFSLSLAFVGIVWIFVTQADKLVMSRLLVLKDFGYFSIAVLVASGVMVIGYPIGGALMPRLTKLNAELKEPELIDLYRNSTQLVALTAIPAAMVLGLFSRQVLYVWTGNMEIAMKAGPTLTLYAFGNAFVALGAFPYYLQFAKGDLKLHVIGNAAYLFLLIPTLVWSVRHFGTLGAGWTWLSLNAITFLFWVPVVHRRLSHGLHIVWLLHDILPILVFTLTSAALASYFLPWQQERLRGLALIGGLSITLMTIATLASSWGRSIVLITWKKFHQFEGSV